MNDTIRRKEAIDAVKFGQTYLSVFSADGTVTHPFENINKELEEAIKRIEEIPATMEWIPFDEENDETKPFEGEPVLVWFEYFRYGSYNRPYQTYGISSYPWSGFVNGNSGWHDLRIIEWAPLPAPYEDDTK